MDNKVLNSLSDEQIEANLVKYAKMPSVVKLLEGIREARKVEQAQAQIELETEIAQEEIKARFASGISKTFAKLPRPDGVYNVYARWAEVDVPDTTQEAEEVEIVVVQAVIDKDGNIVTPPEIETEKRYPTKKEYAWVVEVNHAVKASSGSGTATPTASKRAKTVYKRNGTSLEPKGNFTNATKACEHLGLVIGGDSATRVLARDGYIVEDYYGTDFVA